MIMRGRFILIINFIFQFKVMIKIIRQVGQGREYLYNYHNLDGYLERICSFHSSKILGHVN